MAVKFSFERYDPQSLKKKSEKELRKEYSRLRSIARKRLERLETSEYNESAAYRLNRYKFKPLAEIKNENELRNRLSAVADFLKSKRSTVTGQRAIDKQIVKKLHEHGYKFVNKSNLKEFGQFMEFLKARYPHVPSADETELKELFTGYKVIRSQAINPEQVQTLFDKWQNETRPDSYYLRASFREIPPEDVLYQLPEEFRS